MAEQEGNWWARLQRWLWADRIDAPQAGAVAAGHVGLERHEAAGAAGRNAGWIAAMRQRGATELHVHLLARDPAARQRALFDLTA